ncbi:MAG: protein adenylyltransferase SelO family protein [Pirellulaceae bacterium]
MSACRDNGQSDVGFGEVAAYADRRWMTAAAKKRIRQANLGIADCFDEDRFGERTMDGYTDDFDSIDNSFVDQLPEFCVHSQPMSVSQPRLLQFNALLAAELGWPSGQIDPVYLSRVFSGQALLAGMQPVAQAYAGHQFGNFVPQLGDGRALLLGEVIDVNGQRRDIALKGSGPTAFSRRR